MTMENRCYELTNEQWEQVRNMIPLLKNVHQKLLHHDGIVMEDIKYDIRRGHGEYLKRISKKGK